MPVHRLQSPFERWRSGLIVEIVAFAVFMAVAYGMVAILVWIL